MVSNCIRGARFAVVAVALGFAVAWPAAAEPVSETDGPIACGTFYTTKKGDSLSSIAKRAYGWDKYPAVYLANRDVIYDKEVLPVGVDLLVPCLDGSGPKSRREALKNPDLMDERAEQAAAGPRWMTAPAKTSPVMTSPVMTNAVEVSPAATSPVSESPARDAREPAVEFVPSPAAVAEAPAEPGHENEPETAAAAVKALAAVPAATEPAAEPTSVAAAPAAAVEPTAVQPAHAKLLLLTGTGLTPLSDQDLRGGGLITQLVTRAIEQMAPDQPFSVTFVNDWAAHLKGLLLSGALDVGFPWVKPDCARADGLEAQDRLLCREFLFSKPMYEVAIAYYVRRNSPLSEGASYAELAGKRLCRPRTEFSFDIELPVPLTAGTSLLTTPTAAACFERLQRNETDVVMVIRQEAEQAIRQSRIGGGAREIKSLADVRTLHAIAPKDNPKGAATLALIDAGIEQLMASGEWFQIVAASHASQVAQGQ